MEERNIASVAIVGGGTAGRMSAAFLSNMLGAGVRVTLIDLGENNEALQDEACLPPLKAFHQNLGINEADLIAKTQASMKLGTQFVNWGTLGNRYFHPHGSYGAEFDSVPLHQWWLKARSTNESTPALDSLSFAWALARESRFSQPVPDRRMIQSTFDYAYQFDGGLYADYLSAYAKARHVEVIKGDLADVILDGQSGFVTQLLLEDGQSVSADLFVDCSGPNSMLRRKVTGDSFVDWSEYLPCNRLISLSCARGNDQPPYTQSIAREAGWQWRMKLQNRTNTGYVYASELVSDDDAIGSLMDNLDGRSLGEPRVASFKNGRSVSAFCKNVVALGGAAGYLEPLEGTSLHLIQSGLFRLLALWPTKDCEAVAIDEYNQVTAAEWDLARDFLVLHYKATQRDDSAFWRACKEMAVPGTLQTRMDHWLAFGRLVSPRPEVFQSASWLSVFVGQDMMPIMWDPLADARSDRVDYHARLAGIERIIAETATQSPPHREWIDKHVRAPRSQ